MDAMFLFLRYVTPTHDNGSNREHSWPIDLYKSFYASEMLRVSGIKRLLVDLALCLWDEETLTLEELEERGERFCEFFEDLVNTREEMEWIAERASSIEMKCLELGCEHHDHGEEVCYREMLPALWVTGNGSVLEMEEKTDGLRRLRKGSPKYAWASKKDAEYASPGTYEML